MCTVSFYRSDSKVVITSNRDEHIDRPLAIPPKKYKYKDARLYFPKDAKAGGSWFIVKSDASVFVLLNGAEKKHLPKPPYRMSRGIILLELAVANQLNETWKFIHLENIEPFTIIAYFNNSLVQLRWNGKEKEYKLLDVNLAYIWSSSTLYQPEIIKKRELWFVDFLKLKNYHVNEDELINFHTNTENNDEENGLIINRNHKMLTKNITQVVLKNNHLQLTHYDLITKETTKIIQKTDETLVS